MLLSFVLCLIGFVLLSYAADKLVEGASSLALNLGISRLAIGMTIVAAGTSLPEMVVSVNASLKGNPEISLGNVVGSNIMNAALILGVAALIQPIKCERQTIRREVPIMIGTAALLWFMSYTDHIITATEGMILFAMFLGYIAVSYYWSKNEKEAADDVEHQVEEILDEDEPKTARQNLFMIGAGLAGLVIGSESLVRGAVDIARSVGVADEVIGLTLIAIGTSLPELATSIVAARKGHSELALGNVVGSNIFNVLGIVGCASVVTSLSPNSGAEVLTVSPNMLGIHIPLMVALTLGVLPIMTTGMKIVRAEGALLVAFFIAYNIILFQTSERMPPEAIVPPPVPISEYIATDTLILPMPGGPE